MKHKFTTLFLSTMLLLSACSHKVVEPTSSSNIELTTNSPSEPTNSEINNTPTEINEPTNTGNTVEPTPSPSNITEPSESATPSNSPEPSETTSPTNTPEPSTITTSPTNTGGLVLDNIDCIRVFCPSNYNSIYAWLGSGNNVTKIFGDWPGSKTALQQYENTSWKYYCFDKKYTEMNFIFSTNGNPQTKDLYAGSYGNYWYLNNELVQTNEVPTTHWEGSTGAIFKDPADYKQPTTLPAASYVEVDTAASYADLPAVKNFTGIVINKYTGNRTDFRDESIYFAITTRFYDGDKTNNTHCWDSKNDASNDPNWRGDFKGLIEKMDYIKALGFTSIWITPIAKNGSGFDYHGYHAINFKEVDPRYESEDVSFQTVINEAHKRDMKIILDVVFNHTCNFGEENLFPMFYYDSRNNTSLNGLVRRPIEQGGILPDSYDSASNQGQFRFDYLKTEKGDPNGIYHHDPNGVLSWEQYSEQTGQIAGDCVDLNTENPTVANYLIEAYAQYIKMGVDAFRIDTEKHISRLTLNKYYFPAFKEIARKCRNDDNFHMFGEVCVKDNDVWNRGQQSDSVPFYTWAETKNYSWGNKDTNAESAEKHWYDYLSPTNPLTSNNAYLSGLNYHHPDHSKFSYNSVIDFPMHWNFNRARSAFEVAVNKDKYYNDSTYNVVYVDSHDYSPNEGQTQRFNGGTDAWRENMSLMFTFRGVPCIFYGSEIEFQKGVTIDNGLNLALANSGRAYYGDKIEGNLVTDSFGDYSSADGEVKKTLDATLSVHLRKLNKIRQSCIALRRGQYTTSNVSGSAMAFTRRYTVNGVDSIACVAISGNAKFTGLPAGTYKDLYNGGQVTINNNGTISCNTPSSGVCIYVRQ